MVFKKIIVALDQSSQSQMVFEQALEIAHKEASHLLLFHSLIWDTEGQWTPFIGTIADVDMYGTFHHLQQDRLQQEIETVHRWLKTYCQEAILKNISAELDCKLGDPGLQICEVASNWGADLIVVGRRGHRGLSEVLLGSVSNYILHYAPCSVLIVQGVNFPRVEQSVAASQGDVSS